MPSKNWLALSKAWGNGIMHGCNTFLWGWNFPPSLLSANQKNQDVTSSIQAKVLVEPAPSLAMTSICRRYGRKIKMPSFFSQTLKVHVFGHVWGRFQPGKWTMIAQELAGEPAKRWSIQSKLKGPASLLLRARLLIAQPHMGHAWVEENRRKAPATSVCLKFKLSSRWLLIGCWCS